MIFYNDGEEKAESFQRAKCSCIFLKGKARKGSLHVSGVTRRQSGHRLDVAEAGTRNKGLIQPDSGTVFM